MIAKLTGTIDTIDTDSCTLDVNGVGYLVNVPKTIINQFPEVGERVSLFIEHIIREDAQILCGFKTEVERAWFRLLLGVQGVGLRAGLSILSTLTIDDLAEAILTQNKQILVRADGIGPKVAGRIVLELKGKTPAGADMVLIKSGGSANAANLTSAVADTISALVNLGYQKNTATQAVGQTVKAMGQQPMETLLKSALQNLSKVG